MSAPRTMSEGYEQTLRGHQMTLRGLHGDETRDLFTELDAERAAYSALEQEYESAVKVLRFAEFCEVRDGVGPEPAFVKQCPDCGLTRAEKERGDDHDAACYIGCILSTPRAQAVKEVE